MDSELRDSLREIGVQLDRNQFPRVYNGGIVRPGDAVVDPVTLGEDIYYVRSRARERGSKTGSREGSAEWQGQAGQSGPTSRSRSAGSPPPFISSSLRKRYEAELNALSVAYPGTKVWNEAEGLWLLTESTVLPGLGKKATFLTALPYSPLIAQRSWGFWTTAISTEWIGPRHTNFPDGSVCAFEPTDGTWMPGGNLTELVDLYTLWALRHEHLRILGRWPGHQSVHLPYERVSELNDDEFCGCNNKADKLYRDCCKQQDIASVTIKDAIGFIVRQPPIRVYDFLRSQSIPPTVSEILT